MDEKDKEIAALRAQLAGTAAPTAAAPAKKGAASGWVIALVLGLLVVVGFFALAGTGGHEASGPAMSEQIASSCEREYGHAGEEAVNACRIRLSVEYLQGAERAKLERARSGAGL